MAAVKSNSESYIHYYAKQVLIQWLLKSNGKFFSMTWNPYGQRIYEEYPIILVNGNQPSHGPCDEPFDEIPSKICDCPVLYHNLLLKSALVPCRHHLRRQDNIPSREEAIIYGFKIGAIVDVAIVEQGRLKYIFEIVHTNPVSPMKRKLLLTYAAKFNSVIYEVNSDYILRQVCTPDRWRGTKLSIDEKVIRNFKRKWKGRRK